VLQWVCAEPSLDSTPRGHRRPAGVLASLIGAGRLTEVWVVGSVIRVRAAEPGTWSTLAQPVHDELASVLSARERWLFDPSPGELSAPVVVSLAEVQRVIDTAAGAVVGAHGGALSVVAVDDDRVLLRTGGACHGCSAVDDTLARLIRPALQRAYPHLAVEIER
jgi:Fe-S cluster biogenesis protein NfuA